MKESLLNKCLLVSAVLHAVAIPLFFGTPLHFHPNLSTTLGKTAPLPIEESELSIMAKESALEEAMRHIVVFSPGSSLYDKGSGLHDDTSVTRLPEMPLPYDNQLLFPTAPEIVLPHLLALSSSPQEITPSPVLDHAVTLDPATIEPHTLEQNPFSTVHLNPSSTEEPTLDFEYFPSREEIASLHSLYSLPSTTAVVTTDAHLLSLQTVVPEASTVEPAQPKVAPPLTLNPSTSPVPFALPPISSYGVPEFTTANWDEMFTVDVKTFPRDDGGFYFSLTFLPKTDLSNYRLKQNYYFLIDRSNSIDKNRYQSFIRAVARTIGCLRESDAFNITIFDSKIVRFSAINVAATKQNQEAAEQFLNSQSYGHYGAATDIYASLEKIVPVHVNDQEVHTAILITDGDSHIKPDKQRQMINAYLQASQGKVTLHTAAVGKDNNLAILDLLSSVCRGSLLYSDTHTGFPRKLAKLALSLRSPIAHEMSLAILTSDPDSQIELFPSRLPNLFSDQPFTLFGKAEKLTDFSLLLQGKNRGQLLSIQKTVAFDLAKTNHRPLEKQWATYKAHLLYENYLQEGKLALFDEAKKIITHDATHPWR